jgi:hypothetical protein
MKKSSLRAVAAAALAGLAAIAASYGSVSAAPRTACEVLPASRASGIVGQTVTAQGHPSPVGVGSSVCFYAAAGRPVVQVALTVMETEAVAVRNYAMQQRTISQHPNVAGRQKGNIVLSAISMNGDNSRLNALLDAAAKNL